MTQMPGERLEVFISSAMNDEKGTSWLKIRRKIKQKLQANEYINPFIIEDRNSTLPSVQFFQFMVAKSDIVILIIKEEFRQGTQTEFSVVKEKKKPCLVYIYNGKNASTEVKGLKEELISNDYCCFKTFYSFDNLEEEIYEDVMNEVITRYKFMQCSSISTVQDNSKENHYIEAQIIDYNKDVTIEIDELENFSRCKGTILQVDGLSQKKLHEVNKEPKSILGDVGEKVLTWICCGDNYLDDNDIEKIVELKNQDSKYNWYKYRCQAMKCYMNNMIEEALEFEDRALRIAKDEKAADWIVNDILIDCRNFKNELNSKYHTYDNQYQEEIQHCKEIIHLPVADRFMENAYSLLLKEEQKYRYKSDKSTLFSNDIYRIFDNIENSVFVAILYGSSTPLILSRGTISDIYLKLGDIHEAPAISVIAIKYLILGGDNKRLEQVIRKEWGNIQEYLIADVEKMYQYVKKTNINSYQSTKIKVFKLFGLYMPDKIYQDILQDIITLGENIDLLEIPNYMEAICANRCRIIDDILIKIVNMALRKCRVNNEKAIPRILSEIDISNVEDMELVNLKDNLQNQLLNMISYGNEIQFVVNLVNQRPDIFGTTKDILLNNASEVERTLYNINCNIDIKKNWREFLISSIENAEEQFIENNKPGVEIGFGSRPLIDIENILVKSPTNYIADLVTDRLIPLGKKIILGNAPIKMKAESIRCLTQAVIGFSKYHIEFDWKKEFACIDKSDCEKNAFLSLFAYNSIKAYILQIIMFKTLIGLDTETEIMNCYLELLRLSDYERLTMIQNTYNYIQYMQQEEKEVDRIFEYISIALCNDSDEHVRKFAYQCIVLLSRNSVSQAIRDKYKELLLDPSTEIKNMVLNLIRDNKIMSKDTIMCIKDVYGKDANYFIKKKTEMILNELGMRE